MDVYQQPLVSCMSLHSNHQTEKKKTFLSDDCHVMTCMKPVVADKHPCY